MLVTVRTLSEVETYVLHRIYYIYVCVKINERQIKMFQITKIYCESADVCNYV